MKLNTTCFWAIILLLSSCQLSKETKTLKVATAANMQFAMQAIVQAFEAKTGIKADIITGSSGTLAAQIKQGAPYDLFVSADTKYPQSLVQENLHLEKPKVYAYGKLVIWSTLKGFPLSFDALTQQHIKHIALADPKLAPYGKAAIESLDYVDIMEQVIHKLVYGTSISQVNQFVVSQAAEVGITAKSVVLAPNVQEVGSWIDIPDKYYQPIQQSVVILKNDHTQTEAVKALQSFLLSKEGQSILEQYGYQTILEDE